MPRSIGTTAKTKEEQEVEKRQKDRVKSAAYRVRQGESARIANLPEEKQKAMREKWMRNSYAYRVRESIKRLGENPPTFEKIAAADAKQPLNVIGTIESLSSYRNSQIAFLTPEEESIAEQLSRLAQHSTGKRVQHFMPSSATTENEAKKQRIQGGKKAKAKTQKAVKAAKKK